MIDSKEIYIQLLQDERVTDLVGENIFDGYNGEIEDFPCIVVMDGAQSDSDYADNRHTVQRCNAEIHIFTKTLSGYPLASEIGEAVAEVFNEDYWSCTMTREEGDPVEDVRHRVMNFSKGIFIC